MNLSSSTPERCAGVLLGLGAGDRNGGPTQIALRVGASLLRHGGFDLDDIGARYLEWWREDAFDTGPVAARVLALVDEGMTFEEASEEIHELADGFTAGCNAAHRIAPVSMLRSLADEQLPGIAMQEAALTHRHPLAGDVSAAVAVLCRALIRGLDWPVARKAAESGRLKETVGALRGKGRHPGRGGFAPDTLAAAIHFVDQAPDFAGALAQSMEFAGPANHCPVLVGAIGGARWGAAQVSAEATAHLGENLPKVRALASALSEPWIDLQSAGVEAVDERERGNGR